MAVGDLVEREERPAYVQFETRSIENKKESELSGRYVGEDVDYALITPPYSKDCFEKKVDKWFETTRVNVKNGRIPQKFLDLWEAQYKAWKEGQEVPENGYPIRDWSSISPTQQKLLVSVGIRTIEDLAQANDQGLKRIGMGALALQTKAKAWIKAATDHGPVVMENASLVTKNEQLKGTVDSLMGKVEALEQQIKNIAGPKMAVLNNGVKPEDFVEEPKSELETLQQEYFDTFGKKPHHLLREKGLKTKLGLKSVK